MEKYPKIVRTGITIAALILGVYMILLGSDIEEFSSLATFGWVIVGYIIALSLINKIKN